MILRNKRIVLSFLLVCTAAIFWIVSPLLVERLPANYTNQQDLEQASSSRVSPTDSWKTDTLRVIRLDRAIASSGQALLIQGNLQIYSASGAINFETSGLYGVDPATRQNLPGYGNVPRDGQFLFPPHTQEKNYTIWDPTFIGPREARFVRSEDRDGLRVYQYWFESTGLDQTDGYTYLPIVPERYRVRTNGQGTFWVEPVSGIVIDYEDSGVSYFVNPDTGQYVAAFNQWAGRFTDSARSVQWESAHAARLRILLVETWLPAGLCLSGLGWLAITLLQRRRFDAREGIVE